MRFFYDTEFLDDGERIHLISIGMVTESGRELYLVNRDAPWRKIRKHEWLMANVVPHLPKAYGDRRNHMPRRWLFDMAAPCVVRYDQIGPLVWEFIRQSGPDRRDHELWAYYGAYDHVALAQLWGPMSKLPTCIPMYTNDLMQLSGGVEPQVGKGSTEHNAIEDARWNREAYRMLTQRDG